MGTFSVKKENKSNIVAILLMMKIYNWFFSAKKGVTTFLAKTNAKSVKTPLYEHFIYAMKKKRSVQLV